MDLGPNLPSRHEAHCAPPLPGLCMSPPGTGVYAMCFIQTKRRYENKGEVGKYKGPRDVCFSLFVLLRYTG